MTHKGQAWLVCIIAVLTAIVMGLNYYCVPATMAALMDDFGIGEGAAGWLYTACLIISIVFALPGGALIDRFGPKKIGLIGICLTIIGAVIGACSTSYTILLASRFVQGIGPALMTVCVPVLIAAWFPPEKRGFLSTCFSLWIGLGLLFALNVANVLSVDADPSTWRYTWWFCVGATAIMGALYAIFIRMPDVRADEDELAVQESRKNSVLDGFKSLPTWLLALTFVAFAFGVDSFTSWAPYYAQDALGFDAATANNYSNLITFGMIAGGIIMALVLTKVVSLKSRLICMLVAVVLTVCTYPVMYTFGAGSIVPVLLLIGVVLQAFPAITFTIGPETAFSPATVGVTMGIIALSQSLGIGGVISGYVIEAAGYHAMLYLMGGIGLIELAAAVSMFFVMRKHAANKAS